MKRRTALQSVGLGLSSALIGKISHSPIFKGSSSTTEVKSKIKHAFCKWVCGHLTLEEMCEMAKRIGADAIDLVGPNEWNILKKHGIYSSMCNGAEINLIHGWNNPKYHDELINRYTKHIDLVSEAGYKNLICFSGNRDGMDDLEGLANSVNGLKKIIGHAEKKGVVLQMELFNSKVNHPDYMADNSGWGISLCKALGSSNFKLLYDIYHMQISEGDIISTINQYHEYFGHYHTAGVPGRNELNDNQELNYAAIAKAIADTGFEGYISQEFIFTSVTNNEKEESLRKAINLCTI